MPHPARILVAALVASLTAAGALAQKVSFDYDKSADFGAVITYAFKDGTASGNPLVDERVRGAIARELAGRGITAGTGRPSVFVVTHLTFDKKKDITAYSTAAGYGPYGWIWGGGWGMTDVRVREIFTGTLVVDVVDAGRGALMWRGIAVKEIKPRAKPERIDENVNEAVAKILKNFPPGRTT